MNEIWQDIPNYETIYQVSNMGNIRNIKQGRGRTLKELKQYISGNGYLSVDLYNNSKRQKFTVHRLVIMTFKGLQNTLEVNHIDGDKLNNNIDNLEWVNHSENNKHAFRIGIRTHKGTNHNRAKFNEKQLIEIKELYKTGNYTQKQLANIYGVSKYNICDLVNNRSYV